jgi:hypothetical protein
MKEKIKIINDINGILYNKLKDDKNLSFLPLITLIIIG